MRIGVDARAATEERGGRGTMVRELLRGWARSETPHEFVLYARNPWDEALDERFRWRSIAAPDPLWHALAARAASRRCQAFLSTNSYLTAWFLRIPTAVMVCDMVAWSPELRPQRRAALIEHATLPLAVRRAAVLECISDSTRRDLVERFPAAAGKAGVVPLAADERFVPDGPRAEVEGRPFVLGVGTLEPRKNLPRLIEAFAALPDEVRGERLLVLVGALGWEASETLDALGRHSELLRTPGHVPDTELPAFYRAADAFAYPSLYEGFGLPVLEAMRSGAPVLTSSTSSLPEVAGDAAVYVDPTDVGSIRDGLEALLSDQALRERLARKGPERASVFSWDRTARDTLSELERAVSHAARARRRPV
jgi:glycosyltransferase involved in cell wall biosynthesis